MSSPKTKTTPKRTRPRARSLPQVLRAAGAKLEWRTIVQILTFVRENGRTLALVVAGELGDVAAFGIETEVQPGDPNAVAKLFDAHAHKIIGDHFTTAEDAIVAAETFAEEWIATRAREALVKCGCKEIMGPPPGARRVVSSS